MRKNLDKILLGVLWLMTMALATTFWMNVRYGFDIFSAAHWEYLSGLQADRTNIKPEFYMSLVLALGITLLGLYIIMRPRLRKISLPDAPATTPTPVTTPTATTPPQKNNINTAPISIGGGQRPQSPSSVKYMTSHRPPHQHFVPPTQPVNTPVPPIITPQQKPTANPLAHDIITIFESADYVIKPCRHIGTLANPVVALGYNQTLWIATSNASPQDMIDAIQTIVTVFDDTLGDSANDITLRGCIISPTASTNNDLISKFDTVEEFKQFISEHKNTKPNDFDNELFDAISTYISTVTSYIGKE